MVIEKYIYYWVIVFDNLHNYCFGSRYLGVHQRPVGKRFRLNVIQFGILPIESHELVMFPGLYYRPFFHTTS
jgi:hypothetical protein